MQSGPTRLLNRTCSEWYGIAANSLLASPPAHYSGFDSTTRYQHHYNKKFLVSSLFAPIEHEKLWSGNTNRQIVKMAAPASASVLRRSLLYGESLFFFFFLLLLLLLLYPPCSSSQESQPTDSLTVPASAQKMLTKSLTLSSDNITYDLEDSVTPHEKPNARRALAAHLDALAPSSRPPHTQEVAARINAVSTPHALADLEALARSPGLDALVVPKVNSPSDLTFVSDALRHLAPDRDPARPIKLLALIESARAVVDLARICAVAPTTNLAGLIFAAEDFSLDLSLTRTPSLREFLYARSAVAAHARAFDLESTIDLVCTSYRGEDGLRRLRDECADGRTLGFNGKQCIHPSQVDPVREAFAPPEDEVEWSVRVVVADDKASRGAGGAESVGRGAWTLDGKMIDAPVVGRARAMIERARRCGFDVEALRERWQDQEPE